MLLSIHSRQSAVFRERLVSARMLIYVENLHTFACRKNGSESASFLPVRVILGTLLAILKRSRV